MKFSQKELLTEGIWDRVGNVARGAVRMGAAIGRDIAPDIMDPIDKTRSALHNYKNSFKQGYEGIPDHITMASDAKQRIGSNVANRLYNDINMGLARNNITILPDYGIKEHGVNPKNGEKTYMLKGTTARNPKGEWFVVNGKGNKI